MRVELQEMGKHFGLKSISLAIERGQRLACVGTNGAGKSTLLRCLAGLYQPARGRVLLDDQPFDRRRHDLRLRLHYVPDNPPGHESQTVLGQIAEYLTAYQCASDERNRRVGELLKEFHLFDRRYYPLSQLSRGQRYKLSLVILIALDRELWLIDEPFASGIDGIGMDRFRQNVNDACQRGRTVIYTTQILEIAEAFSDQICILHNGEVAHMAAASEIKGSADQRPGLLNILEELA
ncbi:MAG: ABC transporter ATP-binding protein [Aureliella sp.]